MRLNSGVIETTITTAPSELGPHEVTITLQSTEGLITEVVIEFFFVADG